MPSSFRRKLVEISFRKFYDYGSDVVSSNSHTFDATFKIFIDHCENDEILKNVIIPLKKKDVHFQDWLDKGLESGGGSIRCKFDLPTDSNERDALLYQFCLKVLSSDIDLIGFGLRFFGTMNGDDANREFLDAMFRPLVRSIGYKLEEIGENIKNDVPSNEGVPIQMLMIYNDNRVTIGDNNQFQSDTAIGRDASVDRS
jgi:hypothetical protein